MAVQLSGSNDVLRRPSLRVLGSPVDAGGPVAEAADKTAETIDEVGKTLDELRALTAQTVSTASGDATALWGKLHDLLGQVSKSASGSPKPAPPSPAPAPKPAAPPPPPKPAPKPAPSGASYTVQPGDSLWAIAQRALGDGNRWPEIYALNQGVIGPDPNVIQPGQVLKLPSGASAPPPPPPAPRPAPAPAPSGTPSGGVWDWIHQAMAILEANGVPASKMNAQDIYTIIMHESSGNPNAVNNWDSNARAGHPSEGLMQTIGPTFNAYALPGHGSILNPVDNIIAGVRYAVSRYGSIQNVPGIVSLARGGSYVGY